MNVPASTQRVSVHTAKAVNERIQQRTECNVKYYADHTDEIGDRLRELNEEWDIERVLETNASMLALSSLALGILVKKKFLILTGAILGFLCQHAIQGWCPPLPILRRMGVRTCTEIEQERYALKLLRGDFADIAKDTADAAELIMNRITG
jgi:hypothetical protein